MIISKASLIEFIRCNQTPYWRLKHSEKSAPIFSVEDDTERTLDESISYLTQILNHCAQGTYYIEAWKTPGQTKLRPQDSVQLTDSVSGIGRIQEPTNIQSPVDVQSEIQKALKDYQRDEDIKRINKELQEEKKKNTELESSIEASIGRISNKLGDAGLGAIIAAIFPKVKPTAISGPSEINLNEEEIAERWKIALEKWSKVESDPLTLIEKIADLACNDQGTYNMAKNILLK